MFGIEIIDATLLPAMMIALVAGLFVVPPAAAVSPAHSFRADHMILTVATSDPRVFAGTQSGTVHVWSWRDGGAEPPLLSLAAPDTGDEMTFPPSIRAIAIPPSDTYIAIAVSDDRILFRPGPAARPGAGATPRPAEVAGVPCLQMVFLEEGLLLAGDMGGEVALRDLETGRELWRRQLEYSPVHGLALSPDRRRLAICFASSSIHVVAPRTGESEMVLKGHRDALLGITWLDDDTLFSGSKDKRLMRWDLSRPTAGPTLLHEGDAYVTALAADPVSRRVAFVMDDYAVGLLDADDPSRQWSFRGHDAPVQVLRFVDEGRGLLSAGNDARLLIWDLEKGTSP